MKKILAAMLAIAMIASMSFMSFASEVGEEQPIDGVTLEAVSCENGVLTVNVNYPAYSQKYPAGVILIKYDPALTVTDETKQYIEALDKGDVAGGIQNVLCAIYEDGGVFRIAYAGMGLVSSESGGTAYTLKFNVPEEHADVANFEFYEDATASTIESSTLKQTYQFSLASSEPVVTESPAPEQTPEPQNSDEPAPGTPSENPAPEQSSQPQDTAKPDTKETNAPATPGSTNPSTNNSNSNTAGGANNGGSSAASSTTAAKTADTAPIVSMAVLALAAGTVVVAMRKRVNG